MTKPERAEAMPDPDQSERSGIKVEPGGADAPNLDQSGNPDVPIGQDFQGAYPTNRELPPESRQRREGKLRGSNLLIIGLFVLLAIAIFVWATYYPSMG